MLRDLNCAYVRVASVVLDEPSQMVCTFDTEDDTPMAARIWPPMTTVRLPIREMGKAAAKLLIQRKAAAGREPVSFYPQVIVRNSTPAPKG